MSMPSVIFFKLFVVFSLSPLKLTSIVHLYYSDILKIFINYLFDSLHYRIYSGTPLFLKHDTLIVYVEWNLSYQQKNSQTFSFHTTFPNERSRKYSSPLAKYKLQIQSLNPGTCLVFFPIATPLSIHFQLHLHIYILLHNTNKARISQPVVVSGWRSRRRDAALINTKKETWVCCTHSLCSKLARSRLFSRWVRLLGATLSCWRLRMLRVFLPVFFNRDLGSFGVFS